MDRVRFVFFFYWMSSMTKPVTLSIYLLSNFAMLTNKRIFAYYKKWP